MEKKFIGQYRLRDWMQEQYGDVKSMPKQLMLVGAEGSGKKRIVHELLDRFRIISPESNKIDAVKNCLDMAYQCSEPTIFLLPDIDRYSTNAQNALLKTVEESPKNAYFILTVVLVRRVPETIASRVWIQYLAPYTQNELEDFAIEIYDKDISYIGMKVVLECCNTPGQIETFHSMFPSETAILEFQKFVRAVVRNIAVVSGANSFKIAEKINLKNDSSKIDLQFFFRYFIYECYTAYRDALEASYADGGDKYLRAVEITQKHQMLLSTGVLNKQFILDQWILGVRKAWM